MYGHISPLTSQESDELFGYLRLNRTYRKGHISRETLTENFNALSKRVRHIILNNSRISFEVIS